MLTNQEEKHSASTYKSSVYRFFSRFVYNRLEHTIRFPRLAELKSEDPLLSQIWEACASDGMGVYRIIKKGVQAAYEKKDSGDRCYFHFGPEGSPHATVGMILINPQHIRALYNAKVIDNSDGLGNFTKFLGPNIFTMKHGTENWRRERNKHLSVLDARVIGKDLPKMRQITEDWIIKIADKKIIPDLEKFSADYTLEVIAKTKLGITSIDQQSKNAISDIIAKASVELGNQTITFIHAGLPFLNYPPFTTFFKTELDKLVERGHEILKHELALPSKENILNTENFITTGEDKSQLNVTSPKVINQLKEFLVVGHETTAKLLLFSLMLLADPQHRGILNKFCAEIKLKNKPPLQWDQTDFDNFPYLTAILQETLRLYPPVPMMVNKIDKIYPVAHGVLMPGDLCFISVQDTHRYKPVWGEDADTFKPERFIDNSGNIKDFDPYMYFPFGFAPRQCVGQKFAMLEVKHFISVLISEYDIQLETGLQHPFNIGATLTMKTLFEDVRLALKKREPSLDNELSIETPSLKH